MRANYLTQSAEPNFQQLMISDIHVSQIYCRYYEFIFEPHLTWFQNILY
jgi:hypothetical protein